MTAPARPRRPWPARWWALPALLAVAACLAAVVNWNWQMARQRAGISERMARIAGLDREGLERAWRNRDGHGVVEWTPDADAEPALAVMPRSPLMEADAIYVLYRDRWVAAILAVTPIGDWFNGRPIGAGRRGDATLDRTLTDKERSDLEAMAGLLAERLDRLDPESARRDRAEQTLERARGLLSAAP